MLKCIMPSAWDYGTPYLQPLKISSRGLMDNDRRSLVKAAGDRVAEAVRRVKLARDEVGALLTAMGATEYYGPNRNGDGFREQPLIEYHRNFVKRARPYRDHDNRPSSPHYGRVVDSLYDYPMHRVALVVGYNGGPAAIEKNGGYLADLEINDLESDREFPVSMATSVPYDVCFGAGALVETAAGLRPIEQIAVGELVRTHTGDLQPVTDTMQRAYAGTMVTVEVVGVPEPLRVTEHHPVYLVRQESLRACRGSANGRKRRHTYRNGSSACATCESDVAVEADWIAARDVHVGDFAVYPVQRPGDVAVTPAAAYLIGLYAGDGSTIQQRRGRKRDGDIVIQGISLSLGTDHPEVIERARAAAAEIHGREQPVNPAGGDKAAVVMAIYDQGLAATAVASVGRGSREKRVDPSVFAWDRASRLRWLAGHLDSDGSVDRGGRYGSGRHLTVNRQLASDIQRLWWGLGVAACVHEEQSDSFTGPTTVYVVSVGRSSVAMLADYSAKAAGITPPAYARSLGFLRGDYMHLPVRRIVAEHDELDVFNLAVGTDESYVVGVAVHNCSSCSNKARTRAQYCKAGSCPHGGLYENIGRVYADGHHLHADNPVGLEFFDISRVRKPADRTAYTFGKVAGVLGTDGAALAESAGLILPHWLQAPILADETIVRGCKVAGVLADVVRGDLGRDALASAVWAPLPALPESAALADAFAALASVKAAASLREFLELVAPGQSAMLTDPVAAHLPAAFATLAASPDLAEKLAATQAAPSECAPLALRPWAKRAALGRALDRESVRTQSARAVIRGAGPRPLNKSAYAHLTSAASAAEEFALHRIAVVAQLAGDDDGEACRVGRVLLGSDLLT